MARKNRKHIIGTCAAALKVGVALACAHFLGCPAWAVTEKDLLTTAANIAAGTSYVGGGTLATTWDVTWTNSAYATTTFLLNSNLGVGTLNDLDASQALTLTNNGTANTTLTLSGGTDAVSVSAVGDLIYVASNGILVIQSGSRTLALALANSGNLDVGAGASLTIASVISGAFNLAKTGAGVLTLSGTNTFGGNGRTFTLNAGTLNINAASALGDKANTFVINGGTIDNTSGAAITTSSYALTINSDFTFAGGGTGTSHDLNFGTGAVTLGTAAGTSRTITVAAGNSTLNIGGVIANGTTATSLVKNGDGKLLLSGAAANTFTGTTIVNGGELDLGKSAGVLAVAGSLTIGDGFGGANADIVKLLAAGQISDTAAVLVNGSSGKLDLNGFAETFGSIGDTGTVAAGGSSLNLGAAALTVGNAIPTTFSGAITGTGGSLTKVGAGTLTLAGANTYTGGTTITAGTLQLGSSGALPSAGNVTLLGGTLDVRGQGAALGSLTFGDGSATTQTALTDSGSTRGKLTIAGDIAYNGTSGFTFPAVNITADIALTAGTHHITNPNGIYSASPLYDVVFSGVISGSGGLSKDGNANNYDVLNAANTYTGPTSVTLGRLYLGAANAIPSASAVTVSAGAQILLNPPNGDTGVTAGNYGQNFGSLAGAGNVVLGSASLAAGADNTSTTFSGVISGTGSFSKSGSGTLTVTGANTLTGGVAINSGTIVAGSNSAFGTLATQMITFNGGALASDNAARSLANNLIVNPVAGNAITGANSLTLTGSASANGELDINFSSATPTLTVNPATANSFAPGMIRLTSGTLLLGGANRIGNSTGLAMAGGRLNTGGFSDQLGALTIEASSTIDFGTTNNAHLQFSSASWGGGVLNIANWTGAAFAANNADEILFSGPVSIDVLNHISFAGYGTGAIAFDRGGGLYEVAPVPEPATVFGALGVIGLVAFRERRRIVRIAGGAFGR